MSLLVKAYAALRPDKMPLWTLDAICIWMTLGLLALGLGAKI